MDQYRRDFITLLLMSLFLSACRGGGVQRIETRRCSDHPLEVAVQGDFLRQAHEWNRALRTVKRNESVATQIERIRVKMGLPLDFWPGKRSLPAGVSARYGGICGGQYTVFVKSLKPGSLPGSGALITESVIEVDSEGRILTQWPIPANRGFVSSLRGSRIFFKETFSVLCDTASLGRESDFTVAIAVDEDGTLTVTEALNGTLEPTTTSCRIPEDLRDSSYVRCWQYVDADTNATRILVYQGPCT